MEYHFKIHRESGGYWAECVELEGCVTQGSSMEDLHRNMVEALTLYLDEPADSKLILPLPRKTPAGSSVRKVAVPANVAFAFLVRRNRLLLGLTQKEAARKLGFKNLYSYQRLESGRTANPELSTLQKIHYIYPDLSIDQILETQNRAQGTRSLRSLAYNSRYQLRSSG